MVVEAIAQFVSGLSIVESREALQSLFIFVIGMAIYAIFVHKFYKFISRRDVFSLVRGDHTWLHRIAYILEYIFLFPLFAFFWFLVMSILLTILSTVVAISNIFLVSMAMIATIRITAYYSEDLSQDISKLIPLALLAVFLLDISVITADKPLSVLFQIPMHAETLVYYFAFIVAIEFFLKILYHIWNRDK